MRILTTTGLSLLFASSAWAGDKEISLESSVFNTSADANWQIVDGSPGIAMIGLSGGMDLNSSITAVGSLRWGQSGASNGMHYEWWEEEGSNSVAGTDGFVAGLNLVQLQGGVRSELRQGHWIRLYGVTKASATIGILGLDDDDGDKDNVNQISETGLSLGGMAALGLAIEQPKKQAGPWAIRGEFEAGYSAGTPLSFGDIGSLDMLGVHAKASIGLRF